MRAAPRRDAELGKYELLCLLATGGMASVHLARAKGIGGFEKLLVIKRVLPLVARQDSFIQMFLDEARIAATLEHSNIAHVFDVGSVQNEVFLAMEFLHGQDVRTVLRRGEGPLPLDATVATLIGVCAGLHYAHEKRGSSGQPLGIVHRDVSPSNIVVTYDGGVKLIDFGIAKATNRIGDTRSGILKGKPGYMSPEQCLGKPLDRRSDIFCVGIVLYEMTTGTRLFGGTDAGFGQLRAIVERDAPAPSGIVAGYPVELERIVERALARVPGERYPTALEMQRDLESFALRRHLDVSPTGLAKFMERMFREDLDAWRAAERSGVSLAEHVVAAGQGKCTSLGRLAIPEGAATETLLPDQRSEQTNTEFASTQLAVGGPRPPDELGTGVPAAPGRGLRTAAAAATLAAAVTLVGWAILPKRALRASGAAAAPVALAPANGADVALAPAASPAPASDEPFDKQPVAPPTATGAEIPVTTTAHAPGPPRAKHRPSSLATSESAPSPSAPDASYDKNAF